MRINNTAEQFRYSTYEHIKHFECSDV